MRKLWIGFGTEIAGCAPVYCVSWEPTAISFLAKTTLPIHSHDKLYSNINSINKALKKTVKSKRGCKEVVYTYYTAVSGVLRCLLCYFVRFEHPRKSIIATFYSKQWPWFWFFPQPLSDAVMVVHFLIISQEFYNFLGIVVVRIQFLVSTDFGGTYVK